MASDGRGSLDIFFSCPDDPSDVRLLELFARENMGKNLPADIQLAYQQTAAEGRREIKARYTFGNVTRFAAWAAQTSLPINQICVALNEQTFEYTRRFGPFDKEALEAAQKYGGEAVVIFKLAGPGKLQANNAKRLEGSSAVWEFKLSELLSKPHTDLRAQYCYGPPRWLWVAAGALALLAAAVIAWRIRDRGHLARHSDGRQSRPSAG